MTIREYVEDRARLAYRIVFFGFLGVLGWSVLSVVFKIFPGANTVIYPAIAVLLFASMAVLRRTMCPRCGKSLSRIASVVMAQKKIDATNCPHCGVSFDQPVEGPRLEPILDPIATIRKCIELRGAKMAPVAYLAVLAILFVFAAPNGSVGQMAAVAYCVGSIAAIRLFVYRTPCPRCNHPLKGVVGLNSPSTAKCPQCGLGVDEPMG